MTQTCKYDDQLLDYLYGEMSGEAAEVFSTHMSSCAHCGAELAQLGRVRNAVLDLKLKEPPGADEENLQRLSTQILHQAAQLRPIQEEPPLGPSAGMGKVLQLTRRKLGVLFHPAAGVLAVAALALAVVMAKDRPLQQQAERTLAHEALRLEPTAAPPVPAAPPPAAAPPMEGGWATPAAPAATQVALGSAPAKAMRRSALPAKERIALPAARKAPVQDDYQFAARGGFANLGKLGKKATAGSDGASAGLAAPSPQDEQGQVVMAPPSAAGAAPAATEKDRRQRESEPGVGADRAKADRDDKPVATADVREQSELLKQNMAQDQKKTIERVMGNKGHGESDASNGDIHASAGLVHLREALKNGDCGDARTILKQLELAQQELPAADRTLYQQLCSSQSVQKDNALEVSAPAQQAPAYRNAAPSSYNKKAQRARPSKPKSANSAPAL